MSESESADLGERTKRVHIPFYDDVLKTIEVWVLMLLLGLVIAATFFNILDRNFELGLWEYAVVEKMVYSFTFFLGLFGGVLAARRVKHIAIDAVTHFIPSRIRSGLAAFLQAVGGGVCVVICIAAHTWLYGTIDGEVTLLEGRTEWWLKTRLWRWPVLIAFAWMALHFFVNAGRFTYDVLVPPTENLVEPPSDTNDANSADSGSEVSA